MIIIGIVLSFVGLVYLCWLLFALAVQALPFFAGVTVGFAAYHSGSGPVAAMIVGAIAGRVALVLGQVAFTRLRPSCALRSRFSLPYRPPWPGIMPGAGSHRSSYLWVPGETSLQLRARPPSRPTATMRMWLSPPPRRALLPVRHRLICQRRRPATRELAVSEVRLCRPVSLIATHDLSTVSGGL